MDDSIQRREVRYELDSLQLYRNGINFAKKHYVLTTVYILGLIIAQFATGLTITPNQQQSYINAQSQIDFRALDLAKERAYEANQAYRASRGWFFTCDENCNNLYRISQSAEADLERNIQKYNNAVSEARATVGIFSEIGVEDAREGFWTQYYGGVAMAKRMSYFDALWLAIGAMRRDDSIVSVFIQWLINAAINFGISMISALISFGIHLVGLIFSYQASPISGFGFFVLAFSGAFAVIASFVVVGYFFVATTYFVAVKATGGTLRIQTGGQQRTRIRMHPD